MSETFLAHLADRVLNRPLLIHPSKAETIFSVLEGRITLVGASATDLVPAPEASRFKGQFRTSSGRSTRFTRVSGDTALVTITGSLVNRGAWVGASSGLTSYEGIGAQIDEIEAERDIRNVVLDVDSFGGEATGMAALAAKVRALRQSRYVVAVVNDVAASAAYGVICGADEIVVSPTSIVGSIGVVMLHLDRSREMEAKGLRPTLIHAGAKKVDGNPFGPLPEHVRADMQKDVMAFYDQFLATVEAGRAFPDARRKSRLPADKARATEADTFIGQEAVSIGLADRMGSLDEVLSELSRPVRAAGNRKQGGSTMERENLLAADAGIHTETALRAAVQKAEADGKTVGRADGVAEGKGLGASEERERIAAIMALPEAEKRQGAALKLALDPARLSAETCSRILGGQPEEAAPGAAGAQPAGIPSLDARAREGSEIGATGGDKTSAAPASEVWGKVAARINSRR